MSQEQGKFTVPPAKSVAGGVRCWGPLRCDCNPAHARRGVQHRPRSSSSQSCSRPDALLLHDTLCSRTLCRKQVGDDRWGASYLRGAFGPSPSSFDTESSNHHTTTWLLVCYRRRQSSVWRNSRATASLVSSSVPCRLWPYRVRCASPGFGIALLCE